MLRPALMTTLLLTSSLALGGCGGGSHHSARASSPVGGPSGRSHAQRVGRHRAPPPGSPAAAARTGPPAARAAAVAFLKSWLLYEYGHAKARVINDATPTLRSASPIIRQTFRAPSRTPTLVWFRLR